MNEGWPRLPSKTAPEERVKNGDLRFDPIGIGWNSVEAKKERILVMSQVRAYEEIIDFIAAGTTPRSVVAFRPSEETRNRVADLVAREKMGGLTPEETSELDHYMTVEHIMRMAKARALGLVANE
jgi:hypothetical protein